MNESPIELVDALRAKKFFVIVASWRDLQPEALGLSSAFEDPFAQIGSKEDQDLGPKWYQLLREKGNEDSEVQAMRQRMDSANLRERQRLQKVLDVFNSGRTSDEDVRLVLEDTAGVSMLKPRASQIMRLPENAAKRQEWLESVRKEMLDFATYLRKHA